MTCGAVSGEVVGAEALELLPPAAATSINKYRYIFVGEEVGTHFSSSN